MPVIWPFAEKVIRLGGVTGTAIDPADAVRQATTARSILDSLSRQPGIVLADEVGMGKTYVAMAVIASVLLSTKGRPPVVVMTPPGLASKWQAEWRQFKATCLADPKVLEPFRDAFAHNPTEFFRAMDQRPERAHLIWMSTGCFSRALQDPWIKLALCRIARGQTKMTKETRRRFYKWADQLVRMKSRSDVTPERIRRLMDLPLEQWHDWLVSQGIVAADTGNSVPTQLIRHADEVSCRRLVELLNSELPGRQGGVSTNRINEVRAEFTKICRKIFSDWLPRVAWHASLLVLDEAHHAKNDNTWLAQMFRSSDIEDVEDLVLRWGNDGDKPIFWNKFDRMLFLTATPFQLGHDELIRVLRSFEAAKWAGPAAPDQDRPAFRKELAELERRLNENHKCGRRLDEMWSKITRDRVVTHTEGTDLRSAADTWWAAVESGAGDPFDRELLGVVQRFLTTKAAAERDPSRLWVSLRIWVVRHNRPLTLRTSSGGMLPRRVGRHGGSIRMPEEMNAEGVAGLDLGAEDPLPFLLAARAQGELAGSPGRGRAFFAEGLASSYEAFHHTRDNRGADVRDTRDTLEEHDGDAAVSIVPVEWYEQQIGTFVPDRLRVGEAGRHPKLHAVVDRVVDLWRRGEKVLVFCTYRETAKALREHIRNGIDLAIQDLVTQEAGLVPSNHGAAGRAPNPRTCGSTAVRRRWATSP